MTDTAYIAHCYLKEIRNLYIRMQINQIEQEDARNKAQGCGALSAELRVQSSPRNDAMDIAIANLIELEDEYTAMYLEFRSRQNQAEQLFNDLTADERSVLKLYYFHCLPEKKISGIIHLSQQRVNQIRHTALDKVGCCYLAAE